METGTEAPTLAARLAGWDPAGLLYGAIVTAAVLVTAGGHSDSVGQVVASWAVVATTSSVHAPSYGICRPRAM